MSVKINEVLVSIIIPCYNVEKYVERALQSIESQDYDNIEVICIDDGSMDNTLSILREYAETSRLLIRIYSQDNQGVSCARNNGIEMAEGKFIIFMDADDVISECFVSSLINAIGNSGTAYNYWTRDASSIRTLKIQPEYLKQHEIMDSLMHRKYPINFCNFLYRTDIIRTYSLGFDRDLKYGEDALFLWKYLAHVSEGYFIEQPMYWYFQNPASAQHDIKWNRIDAVTAIERAEEYLKKNDCVYFQNFSDYMPYRVRFTVLLDFARAQKRQLYNRFYTEYNMRECVGKLLFKNGFILTVSAMVAKFSPLSFYILAGLLNYSS